MDRIGVRDLRQNASRYLARVASGETLQVTDRGRPVAMLVPLGRDRWDDLVLAGHVQVPVEDGDIADEQPGDYGVDASAALTAAREER